MTAQPTGGDALRSHRLSKGTGVKRLMGLRCTPGFAPALAAFCLVCIQAATGYETNAVETIHTGTFVWPTYAFTPDKTFHLVTDGLTYQTWDTDNGWQTESAPATGTRALLRADGQGNLHLLYRANATSLFYTAKMPDGDWATPVQAVYIGETDWTNHNPSVTEYNYSHDMAIDDDGKVHILWDESYGFMSRTPTDNGDNSNVSYKVLYTASADPTNAASWPIAALHDFGQRTQSTAGHAPNAHRDGRRTPYAIAAVNGRIWCLLYYNTADNWNGYGGIYDSENGLVWSSAELFSVSSAYQHGSVAVVPDGQGRLFAFYGTGTLYCKVFDGSLWSASALTLPMSTTVVFGVGGDHDAEGTVYLAMPRYYSGSSDPHPGGYHWPHIYAGDSNGFEVVDSAQLEQHQWALFGVRPQVAIDETWPDPGRVWWVIHSQGTDRVRGMDIGGLFVGRPPAGTVILMR